MDDFEAILKTEYSTCITTTRVACSCLLVSFGLFLAPYTKLAFVLNRYPL